MENMLNGMHRCREMKKGAGHMLKEWYMKLTSELFLSMRTLANRKLSGFLARHQKAEFIFHPKSEALSNYDYRG